MVDFHLHRRAARHHSEGVSLPRVERNGADYIYQGATVIAALLLLLSAAV